MGNVNVNLALEELSVINVKQIIGVIQTMNAMVSIFINIYWYNILYANEMF